MIYFPGWNHFLYDLGVNLLATILAALFGFALFLLWRRFYLPLFGSRNPEHDLNGLWWAEYVTVIQDQKVHKTHFMWIRHYRDTILGESLAGDVTPYAIEGHLKHRCLSGTWGKSRHQFDDTHGTFLLTYDTTQTSRGMRLTGKYLAKEGASIISNNYQLYRIQPISFLQKHLRSAARKKARELCVENKIPLVLEDELHSLPLDTLLKTKTH
jgi:hypothetical protein